eukprot:TRINITY_DN6999_c0_g1_i1.p1 TRINITY_DN6999_c0_g1~~TRINITY_DN6999_c0_g1_i1.p1  ORF type:complete len:566 (-),score=88.20 TRINITY_DN6999_c0_g1_i1:50-1747(-)
MISSKQTILIFFFLLICVKCKQPNIIFIVADDLGWDDLGFRSHQIKTPNLDTLASEGVILDQYYVQCVCSPSRSTFLSGSYPLHTGINDWIHPEARFGLPLNITTLADYMLDAGYETHAVGKWHLGFYKWAYTPTFRGFNSFYGFYSGGEDYFLHKTDGAYDFRFDPSPKCGEGCSQVAWEASGQYSTTLFTSRAVKIIEGHDITKPLFLYLCFQAVHAPAEVPESYITPYNNIIQNLRRRTFAGMLSCLDEGVGNVTNALKSKGMWDNTLLVFTADNGGPTTTSDGIGASNWPLRGGKHSIWEGGTRATAFVHGNMLAKKGYTNTNLMDGVDWLPTLVSVAGGKVMGNIDGVNQWTSISENSTAVRNEILYGLDDNPPSNRGLRVGKWKLLRQSGGNPSSWIPPPQLLFNKDIESIAAPVCQTVVGECFPPDNIKSFPFSTIAQCCELCMQNPECAGWTLNRVHNDTCHIKKFLNVSDLLLDNCVSGSGHSPLPTESSQLYDLENDPTEHFDVSKENQDIVKQLNDRLDEIDSTGIPSATDDLTCPPPTHKIDPHVGPVWGPWC